MDMRMFHPTNGRNNFQNMSLDIDCDNSDNSDNSSYYVPCLTHCCHVPNVCSWTETCNLQLADTSQEVFADPTIDPIQFTTLLQIQVVREFGYPDYYVRILRAASYLYSRDELPFEQLPHYVRYNRSALCHVKIGEACPDVPLALVKSTMVSLDKVDCATNLNWKQQKSLSTSCTETTLHNLFRNLGQLTSASFLLDDACDKWKKKHLPLFIAAGSWTWYPLREMVKELNSIRSVFTLRWDWFYFEKCICICIFLCTNLV